MLGLKLNYVSKRSPWTYSGLVMEYGATDLSRLWFRQWFVVCLVPIPHLNQSWLWLIGPTGANFNENLIQMIFTRKRTWKYDLQNASLVVLHVTSRRSHPLLSCRVSPDLHCYFVLTHWGRVTHICVSELTTIGSDNGLSPGRRKAIIWTNAGILLIWPLGTNFSEIGSQIHTFSFMKMHLKMSFRTWQSFCQGLNVLTPGVDGTTDKEPDLCKNRYKERQMTTKSFYQTMIHIMLDISLGVCKSSLHMMKNNNKYANETVAELGLK